MTELIKSIIFAVMGVVVMGAGILTNAGWEIIGLGAVITVFAAFCIIRELIEKRK